MVKKVCIHLLEEEEFFLEEGLEEGRRSHSKYGRGRMRRKGRRKENTVGSREGRIKVGNGWELRRGKREEKKRSS